MIISDYVAHLKENQLTFVIENVGNFRAVYYDFKALNIVENVDKRSFYSDFIEGQLSIAVF